MSECYKHTMPLQFVTIDAEIAQPQLIFSLYYSYIRGMDIDGSNRRNLYNGGRPLAIDFDYR